MQMSIYVTTGTTEKRGGGGYNARQLIYRVALPVCVWYLEQMRNKSREKKKRLKSILAG